MSCMLVDHHFVALGFFLSMIYCNFEETLYKMWHQVVCLLISSYKQTAGKKFSMLIE